MDKRVSDMFPPPLCVQLLKEKLLLESVYEKASETATAAFIPLGLINATFFFQFSSRPLADTLARRASVSNSFRNPINYLPTLSIVELPARGGVVTHDRSVDSLLQRDHHHAMCALLPRWPSFTSISSDSYLSPQPTSMRRVLIPHLSQYVDPSVSRRPFALYDGKNEREMQLGFVYFEDGFRKSSPPPLTLLETHSTTGAF